MPLAPLTLSVENVSPAPLMSSTSVMVADWFSSLPEDCTTADSAARVVPGTATPVSLSV